MYQRLWAIVIVVLATAPNSWVMACDAPHQQTVTPIQAASYQSPAQRFDIAAAVAAINDVRRREGVNPLSLSQELTIAAEAYSRELAHRNELSHYGADGSTPVTRVAATGYDAIMTGENLASGQRQFDDVLSGWLASPSHRRTLLQEDVSDIGLALAYDPDTMYRTFWTMVVAEPF